MDRVEEPTGRIERYAFQTVTLTTRQFLIGLKDGIPETITGTLYLPLRGEARFPVIALLHGAGGIDGNAIRWVHTLNGIGVAAFIIDSFTGRGIPVRHPPDYADGRGNTSRNTRARDDGKIVNRETGQPWRPTDAGMTQGVTAGADSRAYAEALKAVTTFLTDIFNLN